MIKSKRLILNKKINLVLILLILIFSSCKTKINQTLNKQKEGLWIQYDTLDNIYKSKGKYKNNQEIGTWKFYNNNKLIKKEKYNKNICKTKFYHPNRRLDKKGYTKLDTTNKILHWYYFGKWKYFDTNRKHQKTSIYTKGKTADSLKSNFSEMKMNLNLNKE